MFRVFLVLLTSVIYLYTTSEAKAIIFLPAIILIPIAKIVALILGGFSLPALGIGALWSKLFNTSFKKTLGSIALILIIIMLCLVIFLKIQNPNRPLF